MSSIVSGVETLDTFSNSDVVNVCTRLLNEATTTRMNLTEAVQCFLYNVRMLEGQVVRYMQSPDLSDEDKDDCIKQASDFISEMRRDLRMYCQLCSNSPPQIGEDD